MIQVGMLCERTTKHSKIKWDGHYSDPFRTKKYTCKMNTIKFSETDKKIRRINVVASTRYDLYASDYLLQENWMRKETSTNDILGRNAIQSRGTT